MTTPSPFIDLSPSVLAWPLSVQIVFGVIAGGVTLVSILGNGSVLYAFARTRRLHTYANYYIISLASVDLFLGIAVNPFLGALWLLGYWPFGETLCFVIYRTLTLSAFHTSYLSTLVIALDRYFSIAYPLKHLTYRTSKVASFVIFLAYFIPVVLWWPFSSYWRWFSSGGSYRSLQYVCYPRFLSNIYATVYVISATSWIPIVLMVIVYVKVYRIARVRQVISQRSLPSTHDAPSEAGNPSRGRDAATITVDIQPSQHQSEAGVNPVLSDEDVSPRPYDGHLARSPEALMMTSARRTSLQTGKPGVESGDGGMASAVKHVSSKNKKTGNKALRTLTPIFVSMMVSGVPWAIIGIISVFCARCLPRSVNETAVFLARTSSAINPFCYAITNPLYRQGALSLIFSKKKQVPGLGRVFAHHRTVVSELFVKID